MGDEAWVVEQLGLSTHLDLVDDNAKVGCRGQFDGAFAVRTFFDSEIEPDGAYFEDCPEWGRNGHPGYPDETVTSQN